MLNGLAKLLLLDMMAAPGGTAVPTPEIRSQQDNKLLKDQ
jgi:hypothetical protein